MSDPVNNNDGSGRSYHDHNNPNKEQSLSKGGVSAEPTKERPNGFRCHGKPRGHNRFFDISFSTIVEMIVGVLLVIVGFLQYTVYSRQAEIMGKQTALLGEQAGISNDANVLTKAIQHAFITISELRREPVTDKDGKVVTWRFTPTIENSGNTPTKKASFVAATPRNQRAVRSIERMIAFNRNERTENLDFVDWKLGSPPDPNSIFDWPPEQQINNTFVTPNIVIGPHATIYPFFSSEEISVNDSLDAQSNKIGRYFYGSVRYTDLFDETHISKYCFRIDGTIINRGEAEPIVSFCRHWNCTDETCDEDKKVYENEKAVSPYNAREDYQRSRDEIQRRMSTALPWAAPSPPQ